MATLQNCSIIKLRKSWTGYQLIFTVFLRFSAPAPIAKFYKGRLSHGSKTMVTFSYSDCYRPINVLHVISLKMFGKVHWEIQLEFD